MVVDSTLTFAARRNVPVRYDRDLVATTLKAMERVAAIRAKRERVFYKNRMAGNKERERAANRKIVAENGHLLPRVRASERKRREEEDGQIEESEVIEQIDEVMVVEEEVKLKGILKRKKMKVKQKLLVSGGVEESMDVD